MAHGLAHPPSRKSIAASGHCQIRPVVPVLIVVEGVHDVEFLRRLTLGLLLQTDPTGEFLAWIRAIGTATADF